MIQSGIRSMVGIFGPDRCGPKTSPIATQTYFCNPFFSPQNAIFNDETIRSSKPQRESPVLIRNDPIDIPVKK